MNTKQIVAAAAFALVGSTAFAQAETELQHFGASQTSSVSRAEVRADVQRAQVAGNLTTSSEVLAVAVPAKSNSFFASRAQVRADVMNARADLATSTEVAMNAAATPAPQAVAAARSREEVRAEARAYVRSDEIRARIAAGY